MQRRYRKGDTLIELQAQRQGDSISVKAEGDTHTFEWSMLSPGEYLLRADGKQVRCVVAQHRAHRWVWIDGVVHHLLQETGGSGAHHAVQGSLTSPMPGLVLKVLVGEGDTVHNNQVLVILEAMKMQYEITAPRDGVVSQVAVSAGQQVEGDVPLVVLAEEDA